MIHLLRSFYLGLRNSLKTIIVSFFSSFGILFIITFLILYLSFRTSVKDFIDKNFIGSLDINEIVILPKNDNLENVFAASSGKGAKLSKKQVQAVRKMDEFEQVYTLIMLDYRARLRIEMFGSKTAPILPYYAIEPEFFENKTDNWQKFYYKPGKPVPIIAPKFTLVMLNNYLYFQGMPQLKIKDLKGFPLKIKFETKKPIKIPNAEITEMGTKEQTNIELESYIYDFTSFMDRPGVIVPMDFVTYVAARGHYADGKWKTGYQYIMMYAKVKDIKKLPETVQKLEELGLQVQSDQGIAQTANNVIKIIDSFSMAIVGILLLLTVISIFNANLNIVNNMSHKFSLTRILGVTKIRIILTFLIEAAAVGAIYGIIGYHAGNYLFEYAADYVNQIELLKSIEGISFQASRDPGVLRLAVLLSSGVSALSAIIPAIFASNINLFKAVRK